MVFQNYALFPHMSVAENVAFPLAVRRTGRAETQQRVQRALAMVRLGRLRRSAAGGIVGRPAAARRARPRAGVRTSLVLMDEPLGALDSKLREHMQIELKQLHDMLGITILYVTHDQSEALTMSDRIAVFDQWHDRPAWHAESSCTTRPADAFVASFIGENNLFDGVVEQVERRCLSASRCRAGCRSPPARC